MVIRTKKNVPLYEKFGLFTEAPKRKKKRIINIRSSRAKDYTADAIDPDEVALNNISPDEDPFLSGDNDGFDFDNPDDLEGGIEDELSIDTETQPDAGDDGTVTGTDAEPIAPAAGPDDTEDPNGADSTAVGDAEDGSGGDTAGDGAPETTVTGTEGEDGGSTPSDDSGEPQPEEIPAADTGVAGGDVAGGDASGTQTVQAPTEPAAGTGDNGDDGTANPAAEDPANPDGTGDVEPPAPEEPADDNEVVEIEDPTEDDYTAGLDADGDGVPDDQATDPNAASTDPTAADPNAVADPNADPTATDTSSVEADMQAFDKGDMRKYQLFKRFIDLHDVTMHFVSTLEAIISDDADYGKIISVITKQLKKIEGILKDYMILKFQSDSYLQNSFFFEKAKTSVLLALEMLKRGKSQKKKHLESVQYKPWVSPIVETLMKEAAMIFGD